MFNGYKITYLCNSAKETKTDHFKTIADLKNNIQFLDEDDISEDKFPNAETLAYDAYIIFGDIVKTVEDNDGNILFDNTKSYDEELDSLIDFYDYSIDD